MSDSSKNNDSDEIFNNAPDYGNMEEEYFVYPDDPHEPYIENTKEEIEEYSLEFYLAKERDRVKNFVNEVDADETRCLLRDCP